MKIQKHKLASYRSYRRYWYSASHIIRAAWKIIYEQGTGIKSTPAT